MMAKLTIDVEQFKKKLSELVIKTVCQQISVEISNIQQRIQLANNRLEMIKAGYRGRII